jgi:hypothetical protein
MYVSRLMVPLKNRADAFDFKPLLHYDTLPFVDLHGPIAIDLNPSSTDQSFRRIYAVHCMAPEDINAQVRKRRHPRRTFRGLYDRIVLPKPVSIEIAKSAKFKKYTKTMRDFATRTNCILVAPDVDTNTNTNTNTNSGTGTGTGTESPWCTINKALMDHAIIREAVSNNLNRYTELRESEGHVPYSHYESLNIDNIMPEFRRENTTRKFIVEFREEMAVILLGAAIVSTMPVSVPTSTSPATPSRPQDREKIVDYVQSLIRVYLDTSKKFRNAKAVPYHPSDGLMRGPFSSTVHTRPIVEYMRSMYNQLRWRFSR